MITDFHLNESIECPQVKDERANEHCRIDLDQSIVVSNGDASARGFERQRTNRWRRRVQILDDRHSIGIPESIPKKVNRRRRMTDSTLMIHLLLRSRRDSLWDDKQEHRDFRLDVLEREVEATNCHSDRIHRFHFHVFQQHRSSFSKPRCRH